MQSPWDADWRPWKEIAGNGADTVGTILWGLTNDALSRVEGSAGSANG